MASDSGLRPNSELFPLEWSNVQLESTPDAPQGFIHVTQGKTDAATRNLPLTPRTREKLVARRQLVKGSKVRLPRSRQVWAFDHHPARPRESSPRFWIAVLRVLLLASRIRHSLCRERHGQIHAGPPYGSQFAPRCGALLHPRDRTARDDRLRAIPELPCRETGGCRSKANGQGAVA